MLNLTAYIFIIGGGAQFHLGSDRTLVNLEQSDLVLDYETDSSATLTNIGKQVSRLVALRGLRVRSGAGGR